MQIFALKVFSVSLCIIALMATHARGQEPMYGGPDGPEMISSEKEIYEKLGLSSMEWQKIKESGMPLKRVHELLEAGITMTEYFRKPWVELGISEERWVAGRRRGLEDEQMVSTQSSGFKSKEWTVVQNLLLPGFHQIKRQQHTKGISMALIAAGSVIAGGSLAALSAVGHEGAVSYVPFLLVILPADMIWSAVDIHLQLQKELNPDAARFSAVGSRAGCAAFTVSVPLRIGKS